MTKIQWADKTVNPVWGCRNVCSYCYARKMAVRYAGPVAEVEYKYREDNNIPHEYSLEELEARLKSFKPTFLHSHIRQDFSTRRKLIVFANSMSDIYYWKPEWFVHVGNYMRRNLNHIFVFLTKYPQVYGILKYPPGVSVLRGITVVNNSQLVNYDRFANRLDTFMLNVEPIIGEITTIPISTLKKFKWVILGSLTNSNMRTDDSVTAMAFAEAAKKANVPLFMKDINGLREDEYVREFPTDDIHGGI